MRVEHWVVAQRQGQTAARNMLGRREVFDAIPFFWSQHYDVPVNYVGHAEKWDRIDVSGSVAGRDCTVAFRKDGKTLAVASIYRDVESLQAELAMERRDETKLAELVPRARPRRAGSAFPGAEGELVAHRGFEPLISALKGRRPGPLDECAKKEILTSQPRSIQNPKLLEPLV